MKTSCTEGEVVPVAPTFADRWRRAVQGRDEAEFLRFETADGAVHVWTYVAFDQLVARVAGGLWARGVRPGGAVHLALANSPAFVATWLAAIRLGAWIVPADPQATTAELRQQFERTGPVVGVCAAERAAVYKAAAIGGPQVSAVDEADVELGDLAGPPPGQVTEVLPGSRAAVMFTSGTTSAPKGVEVTQANYAFAGDVMAAAASLRAEDRQLVVLPLFHANAQYYSFAAAISVGASVALMSAFSASRFVEQAARHEATCASLFAAPMRMILARNEVPPGEAVLRHCWYAQNITPEQHQQMAALLGCPPRQLYGMTETMPAVLTSSALDPAPHLMGVVTPGCVVGLAPLEEEDPGRLGGGEVAVGEVGEILVGGRRGHALFAGYLDDPATTEASFAGGWFRTGDLASRDEHGRFAFAGRNSDVLKVAGENVATAEIEAVVAAHPRVFEVAVVGEEDPLRDEVPVAFVVPAPGAVVPDPAELDRWCAERLAPVKRPRRFVTVPELPRTSVGKIRKFLLRPGAQQPADHGESAGARTPEKEITP